MAETRSTSNWIETAGLGEYWVLLMGFALINVVAGVLALAWPGRSLVAIGVIFGIQLVAAGVIRLLGAVMASAVDAAVRMWLGLLGILAMVGGLFAIRHSFLTLTVLVVLLGIFWFVNGTVEIVMALTTRDLHGRASTLFSGILGLVAGGVVLTYPGITLFYLTVILGVWLVVYGLLIGAAALRLRSAARG